LNAIAELTGHSDRSLLIVEDDKPFLERLARAMEGRGFAVTSCDSVAEGLTQIAKAAPAFAVVDLRLGDGNGLDVVSALKRKRPDARAIVLTGYGNIATAVAAGVILASGFQRADPIASLLIAALMTRSGLALVRDSGRVFLEAAPKGLDPQEIGEALIWKLLGVTPDVTVLPTASDLAEGRDPALAKAAELGGLKLDPIAAGKMFPFEWVPD